MEAAEIVEGMVAHSLEAAEQQVRAFAAERGIRCTDDDVQRLLTPLRHHLAVAYTDNVEAVDGL